MKLASYYVPGLYIEDHSIDVPLDWRGLEPALLALGSTMRRGAMPPLFQARPRASSCSTASLALPRIWTMTYRFSSSSKEAPAERARVPVAIPIPPGLERP